MLKHGAQVTLTTAPGSDSSPPAQLLEGRHKSRFQIRA